MNDLFCDDCFPAMKSWNFMVAISVLPFSSRTLMSPQVLTLHPFADSVEKSAKVERVSMISVNKMGFPLLRNSAMAVSSDFS